MAASSTTHAGKKRQRSPSADASAAAAVAALPKKKSRKAKEEISDTASDAPSVNDSPRVKDFSVPSSVRKAMKEQMKIKTLFPIQARCFQPAYEGQDVIGRAYTGSGKTLAFALPVVSRLLSDAKTEQRPQHGRLPLVITLCPTRELAQQVLRVIKVLCTGTSLASMCVYGGEAYDGQLRALRQGVDIVVGTCGRVQDLMNGGSLKLGEVHTVVLDEADEMLNMGFAEHVQAIVGGVGPATGPERKHQVLLFSATMPRWVNDVARKYLRPERVLVDLVGSQKQQANADVDHLAIHCHPGEQAAVLGNILRMYGGPSTRTIVFSERKDACNKLATGGSLPFESSVLHGDIVQKQRESTMKAFRDGHFPIMIATDVAARGLDVKDVKLVIQLQPPESAETYVHRAGRTGRAGAEGTSIVFFSAWEGSRIANIERKAKVEFRRIGCPQAIDLVSSSSKDTVKALHKVPKELVDAFLPHAEALIDSMDAERALAACLATSAGLTDLGESRSMLSSRSGFATFTVSSLLDREWTRDELLSKARAALRHINQDIAGEIKGFTLTKDNRGAVFDVPSSCAALIKGFAFPLFLKIAFSRCRELPEMASFEESFGQDGGGGRGGRGGRGGYGGRGRGRSSWGRGRGGGGRGGRGGGGRGRGRSW